jgi:hypothetical protein
MDLQKMKLLLFGFLEIGQFFYIFDHIFNN